MRKTTEMVQHLGWWWWSRVKLEIPRREHILASDRRSRANGDLNFARSHSGVADTADISEHYRERVPNRLLKTRSETNILFTYVHT